MLYRVLKPLSTGHEVGDWVEGGRFKHLEKLVEVGALAPIKAPPLAVLQGWTRRAELLAKVGIVTALDFLEVDEHIARKAMGHKTTRAVKKYKAEIKELLKVDRPSGKRVR